jgi:DNA mismatch repair ATPase MutS
LRLAPPHGVLVTGSNMSGKSTLLRSLGVGVIMSQSVNTCTAGAYACPELRVKSCMGRSDNLIEGRSYYLDEVQGILGLVRASQAEVAHLFLLDELFRGTNAVERLAAAEATLAELAQGPARHVVVAATHDLELVTLLTPTFTTFHFSDRTGTNGLVFDYRLTEGPSTTRNAIALLQSHGAPSTLIKRATALAERLDRERLV